MQSGPNCKMLVGRLRPQAPENQSIALWFCRFPASSDLIDFILIKKKTAPVPSSCREQLQHRGFIIVLGVLPDDDSSLQASSHVPEHQSYT